MHMQIQPVQPAKLFRTVCALISFISFAHIYVTLGHTVSVAVTYTAMLWIDSHGGLVCGLCYNSISDYVKHSSDLAWKRKTEIGKNDEDCTDCCVLTLLSNQAIYYSFPQLRLLELYFFCAQVENILYFLCCGLLSHCVS